jgi:hypothetical protein
VLAEFSVILSSAALVFATVTLYLTVRHAAIGPGASPLVVVAVVGASSDTTVTVLDVAGVNVEVLTSDEWPFTVTVSVIDAFSPWTASKVQDPLVLIVPSDAQLDALPETIVWPVSPAEQAVVTVPSS